MKTHLNFTRVVILRFADHVGPLNVHLGQYLLHMLRTSRGYRHQISARPSCV